MWNRLPWHSHTISRFSTRATVQPWWLQTELKPRKSPAVGWVTTTPWVVTTPPPTGTSLTFATVIGPVGWGRAVGLPL
jgi:hypothetical protein